MIVEMFLTGALLTIFIPVGLLIVVGAYWYVIAHRRDEF